MDAEQLGAWWPEVAPRVEAVLASRGTRRGELADIVQETAARALIARPDVPDAAALTRWALTVAVRISIDRHRRSSRTENLPLEVLEPSSDAPDPAAVVEGRLQWQTTMRAMSMLSSLDRDALKQALADEQTAKRRREAVRDAVRLHRARQRLHAMVARLGVFVPVGSAWRFIRKSGKAAPATAAFGTAMFVFFSLNIPRPDLPDPDVENIHPVPERVLPSPTPHAADARPLVRVVSEGPGTAAPSTKAPRSESTGRRPKGPSGPGTPPEPPNPPPRSVVRIAVPVDEAAIYDPSKNVPRRLLPVAVNLTDHCGGAPRPRALACS